MCKIFPSLCEDSQVLLLHKDLDDKIFFMNDGKFIYGIMCFNPVPHNPKF